MVEKCENMEDEEDFKLSLLQIKRDKETVQRELISFLTYINRPRPEYEPFLILTFFRDPPTI